MMYKVNVYKTTNYTYISVWWWGPNACKSKGFYDCDLIKCLFRLLLLCAIYYVCRSVVWHVALGKRISVW